MTQMTKKRGKSKIKAHYGMGDYYKYYKEKYNNPVSKTLYNKIIEDFNEALIDLIIEKGLQYRIPYVGSTLSVRKVKRTPRIVNGKVYNPNPVDWVTTNKLWQEDEEAKEKKLLVRYNNSHTSGYVYRIYFKKFNLNFKNKRYYHFKTSRDFARALGKRINDEDKDQFNAYLLY